MNIHTHISVSSTRTMDASSKAALAAAKVIKNAKGNIVPSSQKAHIVYGCGECLPLCLAIQLIIDRAHGRDVRECAQPDPQVLPIDPPAHTRQTERHSTDIRRCGRRTCRISSTTLPLPTMSQYNDQRTTRSALRCQEPLLLWVASGPDTTSLG